MEIPTNNFRIFILKLENDKWFLHISNEENFKNIKYECLVLYEYVKKNKPINVYETVHLFDKRDINTLTKKYMEYYGIDNVRGGIYKDEILPEFLQKSLEFEFSSYNNNNRDNFDIFYNIRNKPNLEFDDYINKNNKYINLLKIGYPRVTRDFIADLEWLKDIVLDSSDDKREYLPGRSVCNDEVNQRYRKLLDNMNFISNTYFQLDEDIRKIELNNSLIYPRFVFDFFIFHKNFNQNWEKLKEDAIHILKDYEFMGYTLINIIDCELFDFYGLSAVL